MDFFPPLQTDDYYLDPNGGSSWDKFVARCDFEEKKQETCIYPRKSTFEKKEWVTSGSDKWTWFLRDLAVNEEVGPKPLNPNLHSTIITLKKLTE